MKRDKNKNKDEEVLKAIMSQLSTEAKHLYFYSQILEDINGKEYPIKEFELFNLLNEDDQEILLKLEKGLIG
jgi:hypothetical protein